MLYRCIPREPALIHQDAQHRRVDRFRGGGDGVDRVRGYGELRFQVAVTVASCEYDLVARHNADRRAWNSPNTQHRPPHTSALVNLPNHTFPPPTPAQYPH